MLNISDACLQLHVYTSLSSKMYQEFMSLRVYSLCLEHCMHIFTFHFVALGITVIRVLCSPTANCRLWTDSLISRLIFS